LNPKSTLDLRSLPVSNDLQRGDFNFDRFHQLDHIGGGTYGQVDLYQANASDDMIAVKIVTPKNDGVANKKILQEVHFLMRFRHPCIISLLGFHVQDDRNLLRIAMPYVGPDSLKTVLGSPLEHEWFSLTAKTIIIVGIVIGMYFVHCGGIIHRDLKPANVLLDPDSHYPNIADFGLSPQATANSATTGDTTTPLFMTPGIDKTMAMTDRVDSPLYMAPKVITGRPYSSKADVFSFGVLLYEIVTGKWP
jgi:serine/threonine protein kinase